MANDKRTEFLTVLVTGLAVGAAAFLILRFVHGQAQLIASVALLAVVVVVLRLMRRRFGRGA